MSLWGIIRDRRPTDAATLEEFTSLYRLHVEEIYIFIYQYARNHFEAEDLTADVFERALKYFKGFDAQKGSFRTWLYTIARRVVQHHAKREGRKKTELPDRAAPTLDDDPMMDDSISELELKVSVKQALGDLRGKEFDLIAMKFGSGLSNREIANVTGLSESNVGVLIHRALQKVARNLL